MDKKDEKILSILMHDSRTSLTQLAKKAGVSREVATYRIARLKKETIRGFYTVIDYKKLGLRKQGCFLQLKGITPAEESKLFDYIRDHDFITYFGPIIGKWNCAFDILYRNEDHLNEIITDISKKAAHHLESFIIITPAASEEIYSFKLLGISGQAFPAKTKESKIDTSDLRILSLIAENARMEYKDLSRLMKMSATAVKTRLLKLKDSGVITGFTASIDHTKLGLELYNIQIKKLQGLESKLHSYFKENKKVLYQYNYLGHESWDIDLGVVVHDHDELRIFILDLKQKFGEKIKIHDFYLITNIIKDNIMPKGVFRK